jgi:inosose dehydratase
MTAVLHPHVGTMIEKPDDVQRVLENASISLCLDTGHLLIGGTDPAALTRQAPEWIAHTHLEDVDAALAKKVQNGDLTYTEAVRRGMYQILGEGDVDIAGVIRELESNGYTGWYVLEQDTILDGEPPGAGPVPAVEASANYVRSILSGN